MWFQRLSYLFLSYSLISCVEPSPSEPDFLGCAAFFQTVKRATFKPKKQEVYEAEFSAIVKQGVSMLQEGKEFKDLDEFFSVSRKNLQKKLSPNDPHGHLYGVDRLPHRREFIATPFVENSAYEEGLRRVQHALKSEDSGSKASYFLSIDKSEGFEELSVQAVSPRNQNVVYNLTTIGFIKDREQLMFMPLEFKKFDPPLALASHTDSRLLPQLMKEIDYLFQKAAKKTSSEEAIRAIGLFHWWYAHAMPKNRGSAAIAKMHVATLLKYRQIETIKEGDLHSFSKRRGIDIDVWAMTSGNPDQFSKMYHKALSSGHSVELP